MFSKDYDMAGFPVSLDSQQIGSRMKQILKQLNITQEQAALRLGLAGQGSLGSYLRGRTEIPIHIINKFCTEFNVPVANLFATDSEITVSADDYLAIDIMLAIDEFLAKHKLALTPDQRRKLVRNFLAKKCRDTERIDETLSALLAVNGDMFIKGK